jgi:DNA polymerase III subunit delta
LAGLAASDLKSFYLLSGSDRPKITRALERLRSRFDATATETLSAAEASGDDAVAACNALGLFAAGGRLVVVDEVDRWKVGDVKAVETYLASPAPETVLALVAVELKKDAPLAKLAAKSGELLLYDVSKRDLPKWVAEQFARLGATADAAACRALVDLVGDNLEELAAEVDKLVTWAGGDPIGVRDIELLVTARAETPPFALTDAWGRRDVRAVLAASESLLASTTIPALVGRLAAHVRRVKACKALDGQGVRPRDAAVTLKMHPFAVEKAYGQAHEFADDELELAIVALARLDFATKGGTRLPDELELARTLIEITRPAERVQARSGV